MLIRLITRITWLVIHTTLLTACQINHTDALENHSIIAAPANKWVPWDHKKPLDVTKPIEQSNHSCPSSATD